MRWCSCSRSGARDRYRRCVLTDFFPSSSFVEIEVQPRSRPRLFDGLRGIGVFEYEYEYEDEDEDEDQDGDQDEDQDERQHEDEREQDGVEVLLVLPRGGPQNGPELKRDIDRGQVTQVPKGTKRRGGHRRVQTNGIVGLARRAVVAGPRNESRRPCRARGRTLDGGSAHVFGAAHYG